MLDLTPLAHWKPGATHRTLRVVDAHTGGEPFRVVTGGVPDIPGATMLEKRRYAESELDGLRSTLMWEPRGHADMYGCFLTSPVTEGADLGVLFMHNDGFSTMCGHGIIALVTVLTETGCLPEGNDATLTIDTPAGPVTATAHRPRGSLTHVSFLNVPSFAAAANQSVAVEGLGTVRYDLAFGGAFYAFVEAAAVGLSLEPDQASRLIAAGRAIKQAIAASGPPQHPVEPDLGFLYGVIFTGRPSGPECHSRHVCVFADGEVDRSPTGTGVSARLALLDAAGGVPDSGVSIESIVGSVFTGRIADRAQLGPYSAVIPRVGGRAHISGVAEFVLDPDDLLVDGFLVR